MHHNHAVHEHEQAHEKENIMSNPFSKPSSAVGVKWEELNGTLLLIEPKSFETGISTSLGEKDAVRADVTVLDGPAGGTEYVDTLIFPRVLISQVRSQIGQKVLGRLGVGQAKPGQNAPWRLAEATDPDVSLGMQWLDRRAKSSLQQPGAPVQQAPAAQAAPVQQQAAPVQQQAAPRPAWAK